MSSISTEEIFILGRKFPRTSAILRLIYVLVSAISIIVSIHKGLLFGSSSGIYVISLLGIFTIFIIYSTISEKKLIGQPIAIIMMLINIGLSYPILTSSYRGDMDGLAIILYFIFSAAIIIGLIIFNQISKKILQQNSLTFKTLISIIFCFILMLGITYFLNGSSNIDNILFYFNALNYLFSKWIF